MTKSQLFSVAPSIKRTEEPGLVEQVYNPRFSGGWGREISSLRPTQESKLKAILDNVVGPSLNKK